MKIFLIACIVAMISAGVYGTVDLAQDIHQGTLIKYEKEDTPEVKSLAVTNRNLSRLINIHTVKTEMQEEKKNADPVINLSDLKMEYFSRGEPPEFAMLELLEIDSAKIAADSVVTTSAESVKAIKLEPVVEERKFSPKLFSRGRPRPIIKEIAIAQTDSVKKGSDN